MTRLQTSHFSWPAWIGLAFVLFSVAIIGRLSLGFFDRSVDPLEMPIGTMVAVYLITAVGFTILAPLLVLRQAVSDQRTLLLLILVVGIVLRLAFFGTPTLLEDDYNRYLWDGAVTANGMNPYTYSPEQVAGFADKDHPLQKLSIEAGSIFQNINYPQFSTVYPPVTQAVFAITYWIAPFSLDALRIVLLFFELCCAGLILAILMQLGKSPLWVVLYWWNPVVIKEIANSAHMEPILMLPVLGAVYFALRGRIMLPTVLLAVAAGVKIWPALLVLPLWRKMLDRPKELILNAAVFAGILILLVVPILLAGLNSHSGFAAFGGQWQASSATYLVAEMIADWVWPYQLDEVLKIPQVARLLIVLALLVAIAGICFKRANDNAALIKQMFLITASIYLLAPSQTPWYFLWIIPFACIYPSPALLLAGATMALHYSFFHFSVRGMADFYHDVIVWLIWLPVWFFLLFELISLRRDRQLESVPQ